MIVHCYVVQLCIFISCLVCINGDVRVCISVRKSVKSLPRGKPTIARNITFGDEIGSWLLRWAMWNRSTSTRTTGQDIQRLGQFFVANDIKDDAKKVAVFRGGSRGVLRVLEHPHQL